MNYRCNRKAGIITRYGAYHINSMRSDDEYWKSGMINHLQYSLYSQEKALPNLSLRIITVQNKNPTELVVIGQKMK